MTSAPGDAALLRSRGGGRGRLGGPQGWGRGQLIRLFNRQTRLLLRGHQFAAQSHSWERRRDSGEEEAKQRAPWAPNPPEARAPSPAPHRHPRGTPGGRVSPATLPASQGPSQAPPRLLSPGAGRLRLALPCIQSPQGAPQGAKARRQVGWEPGGGKPSANPPQEPTRTVTSFPSQITATCLPSLFPPASCSPAGRIVGVRQTLIPPALWPLLPVGKTFV